MDFFAIVIFLALYYIRPQEWIGAFATLRPIAVSLVFALIATFVRNRGLTFRDLFRTPHDWAMLIYFLWLVAAAPDSSAAFSSSHRLFLYYPIVVLALSSLGRVQNFLTWWSVFIWLVAGLAVASVHGFDPMESKGITEAMKGRLSLNTSIFNNPNALGHSVVPVVIMLYYLCVWKRFAALKVAVIPLMIPPLYCIYLTQSKGAFVTGFAAIVAALTFGRPRVVQAFIILLACSVGWGAVLTLPRMHELQRTKTDEAIQGRIAAFQWGYDILKTETRGVGYGNFIPRFETTHGYVKAAHSSYVQIGAEMGYIGLLLFLATLYCALRTLLTARVRGVAEERVRRLLFVLLFTYGLSSWMVGWANRATYFLLIAAIAAFHRRISDRLAEDAGNLAEAMPPGALPGFPVAAARLGAGSTGEITITVPSAPLASLESGEAPSPKPWTWWRGSWNRFGLIDLALIWLMTWLTIRCWVYLMDRF